MKGYVYIESGRVVVSQYKKPEVKWIDAVKDSPAKAQVQHQDLEEYHKALSAWEDSCYEVENMGHLQGNMLFTDRRHNPIEWYRPGQPVDFTLSGKKATINKIL